MKSKAALVAIAVILTSGGLYYLTKPYFERRSMGVENFNAVELETWRQCHKLRGALENLKKGRDADTAADLKQQVDALMPPECLSLQELAAETFKERVTRGQKEE